MAILIHQHKKWWIFYKKLEYSKAIKKGDSVYDFEICLVYNDPVSPCFWERLREWISTFSVDDPGSLFGKLLWAVGEEKAEKTPVKERNTIVIPVTKSPQKLKRKVDPRKIEGAIPYIDTDDETKKRIQASAIKLYDGIRSYREIARISTAQFKVVLYHEMIKKLIDRAGPDAIKPTQKKRKALFSSSSCSDLGSDSD